MPDGAALELSRHGPASWPGRPSRVPTTGILLTADSYSIRSIHPDGRGCDLRLGRITGIPGPSITHSHQHAHSHVTVADGLARETHFSYEVAHVKHYQLRLGHPFGLAFQVLDAAGGAPRVASA